MRKTLTLSVRLTQGSRGVVPERCGRPRDDGPATSLALGAGPWSQAGSHCHRAHFELREADSRHIPRATGKAEAENKAVI